MGQINFFWISKISRKMKGHWFCDQYMTIQMKYHFVWNSKKCSRLGNRNMRLLFLLPLPIISYSYAVSFSPCYSVHKWVLVGKTRSAKWLYLLRCGQNWQFRNATPYVSVPFSLCLEEAKMFYIPPGRGHMKRSL